MNTSKQTKKNGVNERERNSAPRINDRSESPDKAVKHNAVRVDSIELKNFKLFENFKLPFPPPSVPAEPDIVVIGSRNGLGKTSILEAISLMMIAANFEYTDFLDSSSQSIDLRSLDPNLFIRKQSKQKQAEVLCEFCFGESKGKFKIQLNKGEGPTFSEVKTRNYFPIGEYLDGYNWGTSDMDYSEDPFRALIGESEDCLIIPSLLYLHSYRKIFKGNIEIITAMTSGAPRGPFRRSLLAEPDRLGLFKNAIFKAKMTEAGLIEHEAAFDDEQVLEKLYNLLNEFVGGTSCKLIWDRGPQDLLVEMPDNTFIPFDSLSSGEKEIVSTLFLIWYYSRKQQNIVLIDEPELHLNAEWAIGYVRTLAKLCPKNQYIIATHSEDVFSSVDADHRIIIEPDREAG
ncbi:MAG TPA: AAA family ATPase [bacterium]|nr:AAA family ATPase [bacterium]